MIVAKGTHIACLVDTAPDFAPRARYALRTLLAPLGLEPRWVEADTPARASTHTSADASAHTSAQMSDHTSVYTSADAVPADAPLIYYGPAGTAPTHPRVISWTHAPGAAVFLAGDVPFRAHAASTCEMDGRRVPVCFADETGRPDLIASAFLWLSGWQERAVARRDEHGRVPFAASLPALFDAVRFPVADAYRALLAEQLRAGGVPVSPRRWAGRDWAFCATHDVDYGRKWRPGILYREGVQYFAQNRRGASFRARCGRLGRVGRQLLAGDPFLRAMREIPGAVAARGGTATFFVKAGAGHPRDTRYRLGSSFLKNWMRRMAEQDFEIGLHPSYRALDEPDRFARETKRLGQALRRVATPPPVSVRQHYLRFDPASTPRLQAANGFRIDSTLGFSEQEGFRRGTCLPFQLYDLESDCPLDVWEMPLAAMDATLFTHRGLDAEAAIQSVFDLMATCRRYGGAFVGLWHPVLGDEIDFPGWNRHFLATLDEARRHNACIMGLAQALGSWE